MSKVSLALVSALIAVPLAASTARADGPAYTAAKATLGDGANIIVGMNVASITDSQTFKTMWPMILAKAGDAKEGLDLAKSACGIDAMTAVTDIVIAADKNGNDNGAVFIGLKGVDQAKIESCTAAIGKAKNKPVPTFKKDGDVIGVTDAAAKKDTKYYKWVGKDVLAMSFKGDKESLAKWVGKGGFAKTALGALAAKTNSTAAVWGAASVGTQIQAGMELKSGYGWVQLDKGNVNAEIHATMGDAKTATTTADQANKQIAQLKGQKGLPPAIMTIVNGVKITAAGADLVVKGAMKEGDLMSLAALAGGKF